MAIPRRKILLRGGILRRLFYLTVKGELIEGKYISDFEKRLSAYIGISNAVSVSSGTAALSLILESLPLEKGDEVIMPAYTDPSVPSCVKSLGFSMRFADIDPRTNNLDIIELKKIINNQTKVIIATHLFGRPCEIESIMKLADENNIFVIEDCAHALGSQYRGKKVGTFGEAAFFSFSLTKPFHTFNGGMVVSNNIDLINKIRTKVQALPRLPATILFGNIFVTCLLRFLTTPIIFTYSVYPLLLLLSLFNKDIAGLYKKTFRKMIFLGLRRYKLTNLQALVGMDNLHYYDLEFQKRIHKIGLFNRLCEDDNMGIVSQEYSMKGDVCFYYFLIIQHPLRDRIAKDLLLHGIDSGRHLMKNCAKLFDVSGTYPNTEKAYGNSLQIPIEYCGEKKLRVIVAILKEYFLSQ